MKRRTLFLEVLALFIVGSSPVVCAAGSERAERLNVLFLICDDLNCDLGCYGHPQVRSPSIDRLAANGLRFDRAYCQYPLCGPSRASFMTGYYPDQTLIKRNAIRVRERLPDVVTLAQMFRRQGYTAARIGKIYHYGVPGAIGTDGHDDPASWDTKFNPRGRDKDEESDVFSLIPGRYGGTLSWLAADGTDKEQTDGIGATKAVELLGEYAKSTTPFFLAVGFYRPHTPYVAPKPYFALYPPESITVPTVPEGYLDSLPTLARATLTRKREQVNLANDVARRAMQAYRASTTFVDAQVGRVLDALDRLGLAKNTLVLFTSDHGYHMGEHGHWQKTTLFENAARVPLILRVPGMKTAGQSTATLVEQVDFYPTLAELCGLPAPGNLSGISFAPVLADVTATPRTSALTHYAAGYSLRTVRYRYTEWGPAGSGGNELYDHDSDPQELVNLATRPDRLNLARSLSRLLGQRISEARNVPRGLRQVQPKGRRRAR
jgi:arylsulfatase A-like enzyme